MKRTTDRAFTDSIEKAKTCASLGLQYLEALATGDLLSVNTLRGQFETSTCDIRWAKTLEEYFRYFGPSGTRKAIPYIPASKVGNRVIEIKPDARIALVGDWGTGALPAIQVLRHINARKPDILVHLGDVYYSGTKKEYKENLFDLVHTELRQSNPALAVFLLAGNHDMYCGGEGYYGAIQTINPDPLKQTASFFCLRCADNSWQFVAMDTGLHDFNPFSVANVLTFIDEQEQAWIIERIREFPGKTILLSHHQLFSSFSQIGDPDTAGQLTEFNPNLLSSLRAFQSAGTISAWFWGHEHNLCIYEKYLELERGRCVGHGAIPVFESDKPYAQLKQVRNAPKLIPNTKLSKDGAVFAHGFATISLSQKIAPTAQYFQVTNNSSFLIFSEQFT
jgi:Calcineurin-like phosphoesterase